MRFAVMNDFHRGFSQKTSLIHDAVLKAMNPDDFDALLLCGDWGTSKLEHVKGAFKALRTRFPEKKIFGVLGNHDYWDKHNGIEFLTYSINRYAERYGIHLLQGKPFETEDFILMGFNGWYAHSDPKNGSDRRWIRGYTRGMTTDEFFQNQAKEEVQKIIDYPKKDKKVIVVTHFPCVAEAMDEPEHCGDPKLSLIHI